MESDFDYKFDILGFCAYCHNEIRIGEDSITIDGAQYHIECNEIRNRFYEPFYFEDEDN